MRTREIIKKDNRSLVEIYTVEFGKEITKKYVVCTNYNPAKKFGGQWDWGHYFDVWTEDRKERQFELAVKFLYDIKEVPIEWSRTCTIVSMLIDELQEKVNEEDLANWIEENFDEEEIEEFGLPVKRYKIVEVEYTKSFKCRKKVVMPYDENEYNADEYLNGDDIDDDEFESDWQSTTEITDVEIEANKITRSEVDDYDVANDINDLD